MKHTLRSSNVAAWKLPYEMVCVCVFLNGKINEHHLYMVECPSLCLIPRGNFTWQNDAVKDGQIAKTHTHTVAQTFTSSLPKKSQGTDHGYQQKSFKDIKSWGMIWACPPF